MLPYKTTVNYDWVDGRVELGYMTDQGRQRYRGGWGVVTEHSLWLPTVQVCTERDEMVSVLSGCHDY